MKKRHAVFGLLFGFSVIAAVFFTSFEAAMYADFGVYEREYEKYDVLSELDMTMEDAMYVTHEMMDYLRGDRDTLSVVTTVEGKEQDFFNEQDRFHMGEVRELFLGGLNIRMGACLAAALCIMMLYASGADMKKVIPFCYRICLGVTAAALALFGAACMADFNAVFVEFHHLFFDNDLSVDLRPGHRLYDTDAAGGAVLGHGRPHRRPLRRRPAGASDMQSDTEDDSGEKKLV